MSVNVKIYGVYLACDKCGKTFKKVPIPSRTFMFKHEVKKHFCPACIQKRRDRDTHIPK